MLRLPEAPIVLDADPIRLSQVFVNLLTNAAKYTDRGGHIELVGRAARTPRSGSPSATTASAFPPSELPNVFDMFAQVEGALTRSRGGLGIGLSLVKHLVELHGGRVEAHSAGVGRGSAFVVTLPLAVRGARGRERRAPEAGRRLPPAGR